MHYHQQQQQQQAEDQQALSNSSNLSKIDVDGTSSVQGRSLTTRSNTLVSGQLPFLQLRAPRSHAVWFTRAIGELQSRIDKEQTPRSGTDGSSNNNNNNGQVVVLLQAALACLVETKQKLEDIDAASSSVANRRSTCSPRITEARSDPARVASTATTIKSPVVSPKLKPLLSPLPALVPGAEHSGATTPSATVAALASPRLPPPIIPPLPPLQVPNNAVSSIAPTPTTMASAASALISPRATAAATAASIGSTAEYSDVLSGLKLVPPPLVAANRSSQHAHQSLPTSISSEALAAILASPSPSPPTIMAPAVQSHMQPSSGSTSSNNSSNNNNQATDGNHSNVVDD
jgi:hypothetical protein